jgi:hypothetical protein
MSFFFRLLSTKPAPLPRWYRATTISGQSAGLGFHCDKCHMAYRYNAPERIFHCGGIEKSPIFPALLPAQSLGRESTLPRNLVPCFWDDEEKHEKPNPLFGPYVHIR